MILSYPAHATTRRLINLLYDFMYNQLVVNLTDQLIIWLNSLQTHQEFEISGCNIFLQCFILSGYKCSCVNGYTSSPFPPSPFPLSLLFPPSSLFSLPPSLSLLFPFLFSSLPSSSYSSPFSLHTELKVTSVIHRLWNSLMPVTIR